MSDDASQRPDPAPASHHASSHVLPALVLGALVLVILTGVWLFPRVAAYMSRQDCIASGHVNCGE